ncbi:MAG: hypothetical protein KGI06_04475 [Candidatus Micrarchaeota archaeon]|nr:hypothetical protein [Candidatus Micrarchaeota archaeon]
MGNVVTISSARNWGATGNAEAQSQGNPEGKGMLIEMPAHLLRKGPKLYEVVDDKYLAFKDKISGKQVLAFKDTKEPITRERVADIVETSKKCNSVPMFLCCNLEGLDLSGIEFGKSIFRHARVNGTKFEMSGIYEADFDTAIFNMRNSSTGPQKSI